jgi:hypothetical protein
MLAMGHGMLPLLPRERIGFLGDDRIGVGKIALTIP